MAIEEGKAAPAFTLEDAQGQKVKLSDFKGKDVVVYFYPKDDTPGCTKEACGFRDLWSDLRKAGVDRAPAQGTKRTGARRGSAPESVGHPGSSSRRGGV